MSLNEVDQNLTTKWNPAFANLVAGTFGGLAGVITGHPFDTVKVRLQSQDPTRPVYRSTFHCFRTIIKEESFFGLFKGISSPLIGIAIANSLLFGVYGGILHFQLKDPDDEPTLLHIFIAGSGSGFINSFLSCPMELLKIRLQNQGANFDPQKLNGNLLKSNETVFKGLIDCLKHVYKVKGIRGIYTGLWSTMIRETPSYGAYFVSYEYLCRILTPKDAEISAVSLMLAGGLGGVVGWCSTYPVDVIKTVIQGDPKLLQPNSKPIKTIDCYKQLVNQSGYSSLFRGLFATVLRAFPTNVAILTTWSLMMNYFKSAGII